MADHHVAEQPKEQSTEGDMVTVILCTLFVLGLMIASLFFVGPSGQTFRGFDFVLLWIREIILVLLVLLGMLAVAIDKLLHWSRGKVKPAKTPTPAESNGRTWE